MTSNRKSKLLSMKKLLLLLGFVFTIGIQQTFAQVVVQVRPARPAKVLAKPAKAKRGHTWIAGHWKWDNHQNQYVWVTGHWTKSRRGHHWVEGHWKQTGSGWQWVPGHWKRR